MMGDLGDYVYFWPQSGVPPVATNTMPHINTMPDNQRGGETAEEGARERGRVGAKSGRRRESESEGARKRGGGRRRGRESEKERGERGEQPDQKRTVRI